MPTILILLLLTFHVISGKNLGNIEARQNIEGNPNSRPNVVLQSVVLGKKKSKIQEDPDEMIERLDEILTEGDYDDYDDRRHLKKLYKLIKRIKSKQIETFEKYKSKRYRYEDSDEEICRDSESEEMPIIKKYESDEDEFRKRRWNRPQRICSCERKPKFEKLSDKRRHRRYRKPEEWPGEGKRSTSHHIPQDILYIPSFGKSD